MLRITVRIGPFLNQHKRRLQDASFIGIVILEKLDYKCIFIKFITYS